ncbi:uncharacterized protein [Branchiostoma lanceolatum]|uniref:uncharacterized protein isoform X1 n=1 Tax=Branchiostoma lanceolatum TaxID=7740 RepID=UPI0034559167
MFAKLSIRPMDEEKATSDVPRAGNGGATSFHAAAGGEGDHGPTGPTSPSGFYEIAWSVLSLLQQAWNSDDYQVQLCMVALGWILLNILLILLAWRRHGSSISDMFRRQGTSASCKGRLSPVFNKRPTWQDKSHLNGTNFNSSTGLPNGNGLPNGSHLPNGRLRTVSEKSHQS